MEMETRKTPIQNLVLGMYVAQLDRPWLETPFLFQGFIIKTKEEIEALRRYCEFVYVDAKTLPPENCSAPPVSTPLKKTEIEDSPSEKQGFLGRLFSSVKRQPTEAQPGEFYQDNSSLKEELPKAKEIHTKSSSILKDVMDVVRRGGKLDLNAIESAVSPMIESVLRNQDAMIWLSRIKKIDDYSYGHSVSCSVYAIALGRQLGLPKEDINVLGLGAMLLDVGKTQIPKNLLCKPDKLTAEEMALTRQHVEFGLTILKRTPDVDERITQMVRSHHERYDGSGYPDGLKGPDIPVYARIAGIVDFYDALITPRPYAPPVSEYDAMRGLHQRANSAFQAEMVEQFVQAVGMFPNGALVELSNGEVGVVMEQNRVRRLRPNVLVILNSDKQPLETPMQRNLREQTGEEGGLWIDRGLESGAYDIDPAELFL
jgi:HD-GYP domain-containing protein (c-di-GMP phosphodiesterase class II)